MSRMKEESRHPILINPHAVALIKIYKRTSYFSDMDLSSLDFIIEHEKNKKLPEQISAKQFIEQLEGEWSYAFLEALLIEIMKTMKRCSCADVHWPKTKKKIKGLL